MTLNSNLSALQNLPAEPTAEALHREEFYNTPRKAAAPRVAPDHRMKQRATLLRAHLMESVGSFFA